MAKIVTRYEFQDEDGNEIGWEESTLADARVVASKHGWRVVECSYEQRSAKVVADFTDPDQIFGASDIEEANGGNHTEDVQQDDETGSQKS